MVHYLTHRTVSCTLFFVLGLNLSALSWRAAILSLKAAASLDTVIRWESRLAHLDCRTITQHHNTHNHEQLQPTSYFSKNSITIATVPWSTNWERLVSSLYTPDTWKHSLVHNVSQVTLTEWIFETWVANCTRSSFSLFKVSSLNCSSLSSLLVSAISACFVRNNKVMESKIVNIRPVDTNPIIF